MLDVSDACKRITEQVKRMDGMSLANLGKGTFEEVMNERLDHIRAYVAVIEIEHERTAKELGQCISRVQELENERPID